MGVATSMSNRYVAAPKRGAVCAAVIRVARRSETAGRLAAAFGIAFGLCNPKTMAHSPRPTGYYSGPATAALFPAAELRR